MEERKLTKADIDKVRNIEGFPIAKDEDIIALSRPPYYTACPNPFIEEFIKENGTPYDESTDDYHREPFAADVSEGKNDPIYMAHSYHTKVPHKAIMRYILHYTKPGDIVFDGFCGTGMTGVAAQMCGNPDPVFKRQIEEEMPEVQWGTRKAILNDLSPAATFIAYNYNTPVDANSFYEDALHLLHETESECGWVYKTKHVDSHGNSIFGLDGSEIMGTINYTVLSDVLICPSCANEMVYWDVAIKDGSILDSFTCPKCGAKLKKTDCKRKISSFFDKALDKIVEQPQKRPVMISYFVGRKKYTKKPDAYDLELYEKVSKMTVDYWYPTYLMMNKGDHWGDTWRAGLHYGITHVHHFFTEKNLYVLAALFSKAETYQNANSLKWLFTSVLIKTASKLHNIGLKNGKINLAGQMPNSLYISSSIAERNLFELLSGKIKDILPVFQYKKGNSTIINCGDAGNVPNIPSNSIDYIFTDPPFGDNLMYSELSFIWEAWLKVITNNKEEAIMAPSQGKTIDAYTMLMTKSFSEYYRILKPNHWITVEFHNSKNAVWNALQEALQKAGFVVSDVRTIDKKQGSKNQMTSASAVQQDLVISAYKPYDSFVREFQQHAGDPEMAWKFVRQHLRNVPITADGNHDGKLDMIAERQDYLLFDRMVAWHIMNGIPVPMDAHTFYEGLRQRFLVRDGMFFLPDQVNEYDDKRAHMELDTMQMELVPIDEKSSIAWLNMKLSQKPMTYQQIQPLYMQELHQSSREKMPELLDMLKENFIQDDNGAWYVPDLTNAADLAKVRRKALLKEFWDSCATGKGKLKVFRMEAIRAGFDECWKLRDYKTIVSVGERLPEAVLQEDPALLMYYDNACSRV